MFGLNWDKYLFNVDILRILGLWFNSVFCDGWVIIATFSWRQSRHLLNSLLLVSAYFITSHVMFLSFSFQMYADCIVQVFSIWERVCGHMFFEGSLCCTYIIFCWIISPYCGLVYHFFFLRSFPVRDMLISVVFYFCIIYKYINLLYVYIFFIYVYICFVFMCMFCVYVCVYIYI